MGTSNSNKYRAIFYYLLVKEFGAEAKYEVVKDENEENLEEKKAPAKAKKEVTKEEVVEAVKEVKKTTKAKKEEIKEEVVETVKEAKKPTKAKKEEVKEETVEEVKEVAEIKVVDPKEFLADFDWQKYEEGIEAVDQEKLDTFNKALENTIGFVEERQVIDGTVVRLTDREAIIDINSKSEGVISLNEFRYNPSLKVGDVVEVKVDKLEDNTGQLVLSHRKARVIRAWERVNDAHDTQEIVTGYVKCRTKGGMIVDVFGI
ncbi:MAG: S1 RNA-binding domain-containing protein, partial [Flavobacteriaceae bacterium]|nr:S1 RNA-binding domain-containing protein [Flavobacteriaceae bacterium]